MPPDLHATKNTRTKRKPKSSLNGSSVRASLTASKCSIQNGSACRNCIGTQSQARRMASAIAVVVVKVCAGSRSTRQQTTLALEMAGSILNCQRTCQQRHSKPLGGHCRNHKSPEEITLFALDLGTLCVSLIGSQVESATPTLVCVTTSRHKQRRETAMTHQDKLIYFTYGWLVSWAYFKVINRYWRK